MADTSKEKLKATKRVKPSKDAKPTSSLAAEKAQLKEEAAERAARVASVKAAREQRAAEKQAFAESIEAKHLAKMDSSAKIDAAAAQEKSEQLNTKKTVATKREAPAKAKKPQGPKFEFSREGLRAWGSAHIKGLVIAGIILIAALALYTPVATLYGAVRTNVVLSARLESAKTDEQALSEDVSKLTSEDGIKDEARRRGYVDEGDTAVDMEGIEDSGSAASDTTISTNTTKEDDPWYIVALDFIFGYSAENQGVS